MTRDEAIAKLPEMKVRARGDIIWLLDCLNILGLLTLDEPKSVEREAIEELTGAIVEAVNYTFPNGPDRVRVTEHGGRQIVERLSRGGFKITKA